jgi:hypothetical protein
MKKRLSLHEKAMLAMNEAVRGVIERHRITKRPLAVWDWKKNKVKYISPGIALRNFNKGLRKESDQKAIKPIASKK